MHVRNRFVAVLLVAGLSAVPCSAFAQGAPPDAPSYAAPAPGADQETIHGTIASFDGTNLQLNDDRGYVDRIQLGADTIVNANGSQLQPGMTVTIVGVARGTVLAASEVDLDAQPPPQQQPYAPPPPPANNTVTGVLDGALDSGSAYVGQSVRLTDVGSPDGAIVHATIIGTVTAVTPAGQGRNAQIRLHFDTLRYPDGTLMPIDGIVASMQVKTKSNTAKEVGGAVLGMLAGNALGKMLFGVSGGGIVGAAGGFLIAKDNRANVVIPADSAVTVQLIPPRRQAN